MGIKVGHRKQQVADKNLTSDLYEFCEKLGINIDESTAILFIKPPDKEVIAISIHHARNMDGNNYIKLAEDMAKLAFHIGEGTLGEQVASSIGQMGERTNDELTARYCEYVLQMLALQHQAKKNVPVMRPHQVFGGKP